MTNIINQELNILIHKTFVKYDLIGVIGKGFPDDEYLLEESKMYSYLAMNFSATEGEVKEALMTIIEECFGISPLHPETIMLLAAMAKDLYSGKQDITHDVGIYPELVESQKSLSQTIIAIPGLLQDWFNGK